MILSSVAGSRITTELRLLFRRSSRYPREAANVVRLISDLKRLVHPFHTSAWIAAFGLSDGAVWPHAGDEASRVREEICTLLGHCLGPGHPPEQVESGREATEVWNDVHEFGDSVHETVLAARSVSVAALSEADLVTIARRADEANQYLDEPGAVKNADDVRVTQESGLALDRGFR